ncbi:hypothetical protein FISHEDRAFT_73044 [Fistulina hepatica ATCC 64428]|uniref:Uncharacterized protein n=1 Tax=Fistulina hepatica ATCC 64428 TaxID=1128425 RepID=A0A0D7ADQ5_9AGAR|nr:hypothetical protein FISHEDRAFT_73044 [Fistulina hepatica ATCC 64428]
MEINNRQVSNFLFITRWHMYVGDFDVMLLIHLVEHPDRDTFPGLRNGIHTYFLAAADLIDYTDAVTRQHLASADRSKGINNRPFSVHQQTSLTQTYIPLAVRLIAMLLRPCPPGWTFSIPEEIQSKLDKMVEDNYTLAATHAFFFTLWSYPYKPAIRNRIPDVTIQFLALAGIRKSGSWKEAFELTPTFARILYLIRLTMLYEIHTRGSNFAHSREVLAPHFTEKQNDCTFNSVSYIQHYCSTVAYATRGPPKLMYLDDINFEVMLYNGHRITLVMFKAFMALLSTDLIDIFEKKICLGHLTDFVLPDHDFVDNLNNRELGYSFLDEQENKLPSERFFQLHHIA